MTYFIASLALLLIGIWMAVRANRLGYRLKVESFDRPNYDMLKRRFQLVGNTSVVFILIGLVSTFVTGVSMNSARQADLPKTTDADCYARYQYPDDRLTDCREAVRKGKNY